MLHARGLCVRRGARTLLEAVDLRLERGVLLALVGPNGAGKTTLLRVLAGDLAPQQGTVELDGRALAAWTAAALARRRAVMTQQDQLAFALSAAEVVALGRFPWGSEGAQATGRHVADALAWFEAGTLAARSYPTLSGGERARVRLARALAQVRGAAQPLLLLDEPLAHLDLAFQHACLQQLRALCRSGAGIVLVIHDPSLALQYADQALLLGAGACLAAGPVAEVLTASHLAHAYGRPVEGHQDPSGRAFFAIRSGATGMR